MQDQPNATPGSELAEVTPVEVVLQPLTGELIPADDLAGIADAIDQLREHRERVNEAIEAFTAAAIEQSFRAGTKTIEAGDWRIELSADRETVWDFDVLPRLLEAGLPQERYDLLVKTEVTYKVDGRVARQIAAANSVYGGIIDRARVSVPKRQYAKVRRAGRA